MAHTGCTCYPIPCLEAEVQGNNNYAPCPYWSGTADPVKTRKANGLFTPLSLAGLEDYKWRFSPEYAVYTLHFLGHAPDSIQGGYGNKVCFAQ